MISSRRPLSPHLQVYRWQITMTLSILHRLTGIALAVGTLLLTYWLAAAATGPDAFAAAQGLIGSLVGRLLLFGWRSALFYHLCNGIRHLVWDAGYVFAIANQTPSGWAVWAASVVLTLVALLGGYLA